MRQALRSHWPEYMMEAFELGCFMVSACLVVAVLEHPSSPIHWSLANDFLRRALTGIAMGLTAIAIVYSPWGRQSGAHFNPAVTLTFYRLGKIGGWDAIFYAAAHFFGAAAGVEASRLVLGSWIEDPSVRYVATMPGASGVAVAFLAEALLSFCLMSAVLQVSNTKGWERYTGLVAGGLVATFITLEAPLSGMSMNPARSLGPALVGGLWTDLWIYFVAPPLGMLAAAQLYLRQRGLAGILCAKLHHATQRRCIFCESATAAKRFDAPSIEAPTTHLS